MIQRLRLVPAAVGLSLIIGCGSPTAPDLPSPNPQEDPEDPKTGVIGFAIQSPIELA